MREEKVRLKSKAEIDLMKKANLIVFEVLTTLSEMVKPGVTSLDLNKKAIEITEKRGARSAFLGYPSHIKGVAPFSGVICASPNEVVVHGIPNNVPFEEGDVISIDYGCLYSGFYGDSATTIPVGKIDESVRSLLEVTAAALQEGIKKCYSGNRLGDVSQAIQKKAEEFGYGIVKEFVGHGIGTKMHEPPQVPNYGNSGEGLLLKPGLVIAIEPMITLGSPKVKVLSDGWTAVTNDGSISAHFEHSVAITEDEPLVLSVP